MDLQEILSRLRANDPSLERLDLTDRNIGDDYVQSLSQALLTNRKLINLKLARNPIGVKGAQALSLVLRENSSLTSLDLHTTNIGDEGIKYLAEALKSNRSLFKLNLYDTHIGDEGIKYLVDALVTNRSLTTLNLMKNEISAQGVSYLSQVLMSNTTLNRLYVELKCGDEGIRELSNALKNNKSLSFLNLGDNVISDEGLNFLSEALKVNNFLKYLYLQGCPEYNEKGLYYLFEGLKYNSSLISLHLVYISRSSLNYLKEALKINISLRYVPFEKDPNPSPADVSLWAEISRLLNINKDPDKYKKGYKLKLERREKYMAHTPYYEARALFQSGEADRENTIRYYITHPEEFSRNHPEYLLTFLNLFYQDYALISFLYTQKVIKVLVTYLIQDITKGLENRETYLRLDGIIKYFQNRYLQLYIFKLLLEYLGSRLITNTNYYIEDDPPLKEFLLTYLLAFADIYPEGRTLYNKLVSPSLKNPHREKEEEEGEEEEEEEHIKKRSKCPIFQEMEI